MWEGKIDVESCGTDTAPEMVDTYDGRRIYAEDAYECMGELFAGMDALNGYAADMAGGRLLACYTKQNLREFGAYLCQHFEQIEDNIDGKAEVGAFLREMLRGFAKTDSVFFDFADVWMEEQARG